MTTANIVAPDFDIDEFLEHEEQRRENLFRFPLHVSSIGRSKIWKVVARRINIMDRASLDMLPNHLQDEVWKALRRMDKEREKLQRAGQEPQNIRQALANNESYLRVADTFVSVAFMDPKITLDKAKENPAERTLHIGRIAEEDRIAFLLACQDGDSEEARQFELFRPESEGDVPAGHDGPVVEDAPERPVGDAGAGHPGLHPV